MESDQRKIGIVLSYIIMLLNALISFAYIPILLNFMGTNEYGLYQLMGSIIAYISIMDFGLSSTIIKYYSQYKTLNDKKNMENILALSTIIYTVITVILIIVGMIVYFKLNTIFSDSLTSKEIISAKRIFIILLINLAITIPSKIFDAVITSNEKFIFLKSITLIQIVMQPFVVVVVMIEYPSALAFVIVQTAFNIFLVIAKIYYCFSKIHMKVKMHNFEKSLFNEMIKFSFFIFLTALMDQLLWRSNQIILGIVTNTATVAVYGLAFQIFSSYMSISTIITSVFLPRVTSLVTQESSTKVLSDLFIKIGRLQFLILSCVLSGFTLFGKQFIIILSGRGFSDAYIITLLLIIPFTIDLIQNIGVTILQAENKVAFRSVVFLIISIVNIAVSIPAAIKYGAIGCAAVTGVTFFIGNAIIMNIYYSKNIHIDIPRFWKEIGKIALPCLSCMGIGFLINIIPFGNLILNLILKILLYMVVFVIAMWFFAMDSYEKGLLSNACHKFNNLFNKKKLPQ